jgi:3-methyladenine DNA glycosylase AlkD
MHSLVAALCEELKSRGSAGIQESSRRFFKEDIRCHGIKSAEVAAIGKEFYKQIKGLTKDEVFGLCEELWQTGSMEECMIACHWSYNVRKSYEQGDLKTFEGWIRHYVTNWATCDTLCNHTVGEYIEMFPKQISVLRKWAKSDIRWMRRASAVSLIIPARHGKFLEDILEIADTLLMDPDDLVQKGYGWMLKAASESHQREIFEYVLGKRATMPRTALRYAIEKMSPAMRERLMEKE